MEYTLATLDEKTVIIRGVLYTVNYAQCIARASCLLNSSGTVAIRVAECSIISIPDHVVPPFRCPPRDSSRDTRSVIHLLDASFGVTEQEAQRSQHKKHTSTSNNKYNYTTNINEGRLDPHIFILFERALHHTWHWMTTCPVKVHRSRSRSS